MAHQIKFKWGWWLLLAAPMIALIGVWADKPKRKLASK